MTARRSTEPEISGRDNLETVALCEGFGVKVTSQRVDVANRDAVYAWADQVVADHGKVVRNRFRLHAEFGHDAGFVA